MSINFHVDDGGIATIVLNRPERLNAMDAEHYQALSRAWTTVRDDPAIKAAVITGAGDRAFTTGADIKSFLPATPELRELWLTQSEQLLNRGLEIWKPVIAAINGYCLGGGMTLMMATDIRVAATHASFGLTEVKRGVIAANGGTQRVLRQLPHAIAMEMMLTGEPISADMALRFGLVNRVVEKDRLLQTAYEYANVIVRNAPLAVQATKELMVRSADVDLQTGLRMEMLVARHLQTSRDAQEGTRAFSERRIAQFEGR